MACSSCAKARQAALSAVKRVATGDIAGAKASTSEMMGHLGDKADKMIMTIRNGRAVLVKSANRRADD